MQMVEFFWDVVSPYSYLVSTQLKALSERTGATVVYRPILLGGIFKTTGNTSPLSHASKARYMLADLQRWRTHYNVPMKLPGELPFPIRSVLPMRAAIAASAQAFVEPFCLSLFNAYWAHGLDVSDPGVLVQVATSMGMDGDALLAATERQATKDALHQSTEEAVQRGAFGAPTLFVGNDMFFGNDRLHLLEAHLGKMAP